MDFPRLHHFSSRCLFLALSLFIGHARASICSASPYAARSPQIFSRKLPAPARLYLAQDGVGEDGEETPKMEQPTPDDAQLLARYNALMQEVDKPGNPGREFVNQSRGGRMDMVGRILGSTTPVRAESLSRARGYVKAMIPQLETIRSFVPPPVGRIVQRRGELKIDGKLDEPAWQNAAKIPLRFEELQKFDGPAPTVRLLWDDKFLYAGFNVPDTNIIAPVMPRDSEVWRYDCVEMFILAQPRFGVHWELNVSPTGSLLDSLLYKYQTQWGDDTRDEETLEGLQIGRTISGTPNKEDDKDTGYTIELAIPFNQISGMSPRVVKGDMIHLMLASVNLDGTDNQSRSSYRAHVPYIAWLHNIWVYQPFLLVADEEKASTKKSASKPVVASKPAVGKR